MTHEEIQSPEKALAFAMFMLEFCCVAYPTLLTDENLRADKKAQYAWLSGGMLGMLALGLYLIALGRMEPGKALAEFGTGADLAFGLQLPIAGACGGLALRYAVPKALCFTRGTQTADADSYAELSDSENDDPAIADDTPIAAGVPRFDSP